jgi:molybdate transport system substrate-binding protein
MRKNLWSLTIGLLSAALLLAGCGGGSTPAKPAATPAAAPVELTISAAVSLKDALKDVQAAYLKKAPQVKLVFNLGASGSLQKQIEQGAPADIFISAAPKQMNELETKNLIRKPTRRNLVENKLVLIVPQYSQLKIARFEELANSDVKKLGIGEPNVVPAGQYAQQALKKLGIWDPVADRIVFAKDVRTVLAYVETGNVDAGIVYKTDAASSSKVKIAATAPEGSHQPVLYPAAILANSKNVKAAEEFMGFLSSPDGKAIFEKHGFAMSRQ